MLSSVEYGRALLRQECVYNQGRGLLVTTGTWMEEKLTLLPHNNPRKPPPSANVVKTAFTETNDTTTLDLMM